MGLLDFFRKPPTSAGVAKERLRIIVAQERSSRGAPDYLPLLRREILEVMSTSAVIKVKKSSSCRSLCR
jgi:cell division topological specificity factor